MAMLERDRRATAGKRMANLVGEELEKDQSFWGHDTWEEEEEDSEYSESTGEVVVVQVMMMAMMMIMMKVC